MILKGLPILTFTGLIDNFDFPSNLTNDSAPLKSTSTVY